MTLKGHDHCLQLQTFSWSKSTLLPSATAAEAANVSALIDVEPVRHHISFYELIVSLCYRKYAAGMSVSGLSTGWSSYTVTPAFIWLFSVQQLSSALPCNELRHHDPKRLQAMVSILTCVRSSERWYNFCTTFRARGMDCQTSSCCICFQVLRAISLFYIFAARRSYSF